MPIAESIGVTQGTKKEKINQIKAPKPGMILNVSAKEGDLVKDGDTLLILEAMKMEKSILAPKDSIIKSVNIKNNETVEKGELMIEMD